MELYYTFHNTHAVILAEKLLLSAGFAVKVRPLPASISAGCGMCLCISSNLRSQAEAELKNRSVNFSAVYLADNGKFLPL